MFFLFNFFFVDFFFPFFFNFLLNGKKLGFSVLICSNLSLLFFSAFICFFCLSNLFFNLCFFLFNFSFLLFNLFKCFFFHTCNSFFLLLIIASLFLFFLFIIIINRLLFSILISLSCHLSTLLGHLGNMVILTLYMEGLNLFHRMFFLGLCQYLY